ncbi:hypothetical protein BpHYR1_052898 [Brachionus plicatilis]|uniref:Uncharacterized protein n=1 Tax=Brachionus plicatilis TaxID=10195 RepID=A0A3M7RS95_BRAPC|nr:hypothetical protein BpHYR1_052898 [Brachionus plicatilis]
MDNCPSTIENGKFVDNFFLEVFSSGTLFTGRPLFFKGSLSPPLRYKTSSSSSKGHGLDLTYDLNY